MDFLSFLTEVMSFVVDIAKTIAALTAVGCIFLLIRLLPSRIRGFVSAIATSLLFFALFKSSVQQFAFIAIKTSIINYALVNITALTVLFFLYVATNCGFIFSRESGRIGDFIPPGRVGVKKCFSRNDSIVASNSYLSISPVSLQ